MPELPEVETVRRGLAPVMEGARIARVEQRRADLRWPFPEDFVERLKGRRIARLDRRAKYIVARLDDGQALIMHLGMSGRFLVARPAAAEAEQRAAAEPGAFYLARPRDPAHDHVIFHFEGGARVTYNDARRFGFMALSAPGMAESPHLARLGIEPLGPDMNAALLASAFAGRTTSLKAALMDQRIVAGLGNIYVCEALHRAGLSPARPAGTLRGVRVGRRAARLALAIRAVLEEAVAAGGSTLRDHALTDGTPGAFQQRFAVYDRMGEPCPRPACSGEVRRIVQSGRSTFYCPVCQR